MKKFLGVLVGVIFLAGCAQFCGFGSGGEGGGLKCQRLMSKAEVDMTMKETEARLGSPQSRRLDVEYGGIKYDEVWIYGTAPQTMLYFKGGKLEHRDYGDSYKR